MKEYEESNLKFVFENKWLLPDFVNKEGENIGKLAMFDEHPAYIDGIQKIGNYRFKEEKKKKDEKETYVRVGGAKAVDFIGILEGKIYFIEVKNMRGSNEINTEHIGVDIVTKIKDSLACIIGAKYNVEEDKLFWNKIVEILNQAENNIQIILWLELNFGTSKNIISNKKWNAENTDATGNYKKWLIKKLKWLIPKENINIYGIADYPKTINLTVSKKNL